MIPITTDQILTLAPSTHLIYRKALVTIDEELSKRGINETPLRLAHFFAQILHESGGLRIMEENLRYTSAVRIRAIFGLKRFPTILLAQECVKSPYTLGEKVYGGRMGNDVQGDGWKYRGRGPIQLTGKNNYRTYGDRLGIDLVKNPELAIDPRYALVIPAEYWASKNLNGLADADNLYGITKAINGGSVGIKDREIWLKKTKAMWCAETLAAPE